MSVMVLSIRSAVMALTILGATWSLPAHADRREALVIGNNSYPEMPLRNPVNDAEAMQGQLQKLGFQTRLVRNAGWRDMIQTVQTFIVETEAADLRLIYYAGHGAQIRGRNYLIPVDAPMGDSDALSAQSLDANEVLSRLARHSKGLNLLILDACRNNPLNQYRLSADGRRLKLRGAGQGLAAMQTAPGTLVAFSTALGSVADDGPDQTHSMYTRHLLREMATPDVTLEQMFKRVRIAVLKESDQRQRPWEESSLTTDYCLVSTNKNSACAVSTQAMR